MDEFTQLRLQIDEIDNKLMDLLVSRSNISRQIGKLKKRNNIPVFQKEREEEIIAKKVKIAKELSLNEEFVKELYLLIMEESRNIQTKVINEKQD